MPLDPEKIKEYREQVNEAEGRQDKIAIIAKYELAISIPIVLQIHLDISKKLEENGLISKIDAEQQKFVSKSIDGFVKADEKLNPGFFGAIKMGYNYLTTDEYTKKFITDNLNAMVEMAEKMVVPKSVVALWSEAAIWYRGMYQHVSNLAKRKDGRLNEVVYKDPDGVSKPVKLVLIPGDEDDQKFMDWVGLTKYSIAKYYRKFSRIINKRIQEPVDDEKLLSQQDSIIVEQNCAQVPSLTFFDRQVMRLEFNLCYYLQQHHNDVIGNRVAALKFAFSKRHISQGDEERIESLFPQIVKSIERYSKSWTRTNGYLPSVWGRAHRGDVASTNNGIDEEALYSKKVLKLIELWEEVSQDSRSDLRKKLEPQLNNLFVFLEKAPEPEKAHLAVLKQ